jgi:nicotinamide mononucleotide transporter
MGLSKDSWILLALTLAATVMALCMQALGKASWLEVGAFVTGALCVWLTVKESVWNFPLSMVNVAVFLFVFINARLYADAGLQVVYLVLSAVGWWMWRFGGAARSELRISLVPFVEAMVLALLALLFTLGMTLYLRRVPGTVPLADAGTTALCLAAQWLLNRKRLGNWWCWIVADVVYIPLYAYKELYLTSILYVVFLGMATMGLLEWRARFATQRAREQQALLLQELRT